jgi:hypothetical protein
MKTQHSRILIIIRQILGNILKNQFVGFRFLLSALIQEGRGDHVGADETGEVQIWAAVKVEFIVDELVGCIGRDTSFWKGVFRDCFCAAITAGVGRRDAAVGIVEVCVTKMATQFDDSIWINVLSLTSIDKFVTL